MFEKMKTVRWWRLDKRPNRHHALLNREQGRQSGTTLCGAAVGGGLEVEASLASLEKQAATLCGNCVAMLDDRCVVKPANRAEAS